MRAKTGLQKAVVLLRAGTARIMRSPRAAQARDALLASAPPVRRAIEAVYAWSDRRPKRPSVTLSDLSPEARKIYFALRKEVERSG